MGHEEHMKHAKEHVACAVVTVSDSRTEETDVSGRIIIDRLKEAGHTVVEYTIIEDSLEKIESELRNLLEMEGLSVIIINGGTGITRRDVTPEAVMPFLEKKLVGFGELFRLLSYQEIGPAGMMSRALGGISAGKIILCLPGSTGAIELAMTKIVIPQIGHMVLEVEK
jgi:molybdenum cofactor biosynthesis protein B